MDRKNEGLIVEKHRANIQNGLNYWPEAGVDGMPAMGDYRWTADLILSNWVMAETGSPPQKGNPDGADLEYRIGASGGGFDVLDFKFLPEAEWTPGEVEIDLSIPLNRRAYDPRITLPIPVYGGGMSYGSISEQVMLARAMAAQRWGTFTSTGEGGYPDSLVPYRDHIITQVATGMFGVREQTIPVCPDRRIQVCPGGQAGVGRPPAG